LKRPPIGIIEAKPGKTSTDVIAGESKGAAAAADIVGAEFGYNNNGKYAGLVLTLHPFASAGVSYGFSVPIQKPRR
jgi:hypothetical protein